MDFLTLAAAGVIMKRKRKALPLAIAAAIGGVYGVVSVAANLRGIIEIPATFAVCSLMCLVGYGKSGGAAQFFKLFASVWGVGVLLGGVMTAICSLGGNPAVSVPVSGKSGPLSFILAAGALITWLGVKLFTYIKHVPTAIVEAGLCGKKVAFSALCDSGNLVRDPISSKSVIITDKSVISGLFDESTLEKLCTGDAEGLPEKIKKRVRIIPVRSEDGSRLLLGFLPDSLTVRTDKKSSECDGIIAVESNTVSYGGYPANLPGSLLP